MDVPKGTRADAIPTVRGTRLIGNLVDFMRRPVDFLADAFRHYGAIFRVGFGGSKAIFVGGTAARDVLLYRVSTYHAPLNHAGYDWFSYPPNMPAMCSAAPPAIANATEQQWRAMLPPLDIARETLDQEYLLTCLILPGHRLGEYSSSEFTAPRVKPLVDAFVAELEGIEATITMRNLARPVAFPWMLPSCTTASVAS